MKKSEKLKIENVKIGENKRERSVMNRLHVF